ncbi:MAG: GtrA family protein [Oscillospiraceae bacterium]|jgi:putative flippase GtrA|nr:GtrA family protein [Oscillospiraceae bacterium]
MTRLHIIISKHKTLLLYLIAGGLTTLVNYVIFFALMLALGEEFNFMAMLSEESGNPAVFNIANTVAVVGAVIFAYFINKLMVFQTKCENFRDLIREITAFFTSRVVTMLFEIGACAFLVTLLGFPEFSTKLGVTVVVILLNYLLSVTIVFRKKEK